MRSSVLLRQLLKILTPVILLALSGCGEIPAPLGDIEGVLKDASSYSIILEDMKEEGNILKEYYHRYRVVREDTADTTDWMQVPEEVYQANEALLGMTIAGKKDGEELPAAAPPGYQYVGDPRYGSWQTDSAGRTFWAFAGGMALGRMLDMGRYPPVYRNDYDAYTAQRSRKSPYFGRNNEYGTFGKVEQKARPDFYARRMAKQAQKKSTFLNKVGERTGRTKTNFRGRSGGRGK
ncbi:hypothetical protein [Desulfococcus sp.]|uniref:hypothetical protein n=1 Tax=Desulfococcus sp. TaxID=2025834 RepID=UPI0035946A52